MRPVVGDDLVLSFTAVLILLLAVAAVAVYNIGRPELAEDARTWLDDQLTKFKTELGETAKARAQERESSLGKKDVRAEYRKRRAGKLRRIFQVLLSYRAFWLAGAGVIFALPIIPHFPKLSAGYKHTNDFAGAGVAFLTFGFEGTDVGSRLAERFLRKPDGDARARDLLERYCQQLKRAVERRARRRARGTTVPREDVETAWVKLVKTVSQPKQSALRGRARWLIALALGGGLYFGVPFARASLPSDSYWLAVVIPAAILIYYLLAANALGGTVAAVGHGIGALRPSSLLPRFEKLLNIFKPNESGQVPERPVNTPGSNDVSERPKEEHTMAYGGARTQRPTISIARLAALVGEFIGLLNKGSASAPAAPGGEAAGLAVSTNTLNVTRVGGVGALISGAGGAALLLFKVNKSKDPHAIVVAAYISVGVIVAAALIAVSMIIVADVRARTGLAAAAAAAAKPAPATAAARVKYIETEAAGGADTTVSLDRAYDFVIVNAGASGLKLALPTAGSARWQHMSINREDNAGDKVVTLLAQNQDHVLSGAEATLAPGHTMQLYSDGESWLAVQ